MHGLQPRIFPRQIAWNGDARKRILHHLVPGRPKPAHMPVLQCRKERLPRFAGHRRCAFHEPEPVHRDALQTRQGLAESVLHALQVRRVTDDGEDLELREGGEHVQRYGEDTLLIAFVWRAQLCSPQRQALNARQRVAGSLQRKTIAPVSLKVPLEGHNNLNRRTQNTVKN